MINNVRLLKRRVMLIILLSLLICQYACKSYPPAMSGVPLGHVYDALTREGSERDNYGMYTYVLFGKKVNASDKTDPLVMRYENILSAIVDNKHADDAVLHDYELNIFYIPANERFGHENAGLDTYNFSLAINYIRRLAMLVQNDTGLYSRYANGAGPFLVSTYKPLGRMTEGELKLLYVDLSDAHSGAIREIVEAYKQRIEKDLVDDTEEFRSIRLALLNLLLNANDSMKVVKAEAADFLSTITN